MMTASLRTISMFAARTAYISILYLLISIILWVIGWFQWWISLPLVLLLLWGTYKLWPEVKEHYTCSQSVPWWGWMMLCAYAAGCVFLCGFDGRLQQSWDFIVRNPLYAHLVAYEWPMELSQGSGVVVYPMQFWLVPALMSKVLSGCTTMLLQLWVFAGMLLIGLNVWQILGGKRTIIMLGSLLVFAPLTLVADDVLNVIFWKNAYYSVHFRLPSPLTQMLNTFHFYVTGCLALSLLVARRPSCLIWVVVTGCLAIMHPMLALILFPWAVYQFFCAWKQAGYAWKNLVLHPIVPGIVAAAALAVIYYAANSGSETCLVFDAPHAKGYSLSYICSFASGAMLHIIPLLFAWYFSRRGILLYLACCVPVLTLFWMGQSNGISEWWYKFSVAYGFILLLACMLVWEKKMIRAGWLVLMGLSLISFLRVMKDKNIPLALRHGFAPQAQFVENEYADMNHLNPDLHKQFVSETFKFPLIFRSHHAPQ